MTEIIALLLANAYKVAMILIAGGVMASWVLSDLFARRKLSDGWRCQDCRNKTRKIDAHHITALARIIRDLLQGRQFANDTETVEWLITQPEIADPELRNGKTLCRECHKAVHNWGSHAA